MCIRDRFYNKANFTEGGGELELPTTWDEFFALADKTDIPLFTYPVAGYLDAFTYAMMAEVGGQEFFNKALQYDEKVWSSPEMDQMLSLIHICVVTDICVVSNAVLLHSAFLNARVAVLKDLCAAATPEGHARALALLAGMGYEIV